MADNDRVDPFRHHPVDVAIRDIIRWAREVKTRDAAPVRPMNLDPQTLVLMFGVALAAAFDGALSSSRTPAALAVAIGALSAWVAVRDWPDRKHYLIGACAALTALFMISPDVPARGFAVLVFAVSGALAVEALIDYWKARHADTI
jgi:hypothetical protein